MDHLLWYPGHRVLIDNIVRAENCCLYDDAGNRYVDLESGVWCTIIGHGHPRIRQVMAAQAAAVAHTGFSYSSALVQDTARTVLALHGFDDGRCVLLCSGSEAVEVGVRAMQAVMVRPMLLTMADAYCGAYGSANLRRSDEWIGFDWTECAGCDPAGCCDASCARWSAVPWERIGGFLFEPGSSSGLVRFPPDKLIRSIGDLIHAGDGLIMVNEVTTGMGRTGTWFGYQHYTMRPDIVAMGKGLGNGYPVAATVFNQRSAERLMASDFKYAQSHQNDPLGAAVAREVVRIIDEADLIDRGRRIGAVLVQGIENMMPRLSCIRTIRHRGLMAALELEDPAAGAFADRVHQALLHEGFVLSRRPGLNVLRLDPALTIDRADIDRFLETVERVLTAAAG